MKTTIFPAMYLVKQRFNGDGLKDIPGAVKGELDKLALPKQLSPGAKVAIACGSRGIANYDIIIKTLINYLKNLDLDVFIIPAMGSHGGATSRGQLAILAHLGITEETMGVPVKSEMDTVVIGSTKRGIPVFMSKPAWEADYIIPVNRIKKHTEFYGRIESGLHKMLAIGLGKQDGADVYHNAMLNFGYTAVILEAAGKILETGKIPFGIGIVENGYSDTHSIYGVRGDEFYTREKELLKLSKSLDPKLPFDEADILIVDEIGKEISGTGFDTKIIGRIGLPLLADEPLSPRIKRIIVCDLTEKTEGNAIGVGIADFVTRRLVDKIDFNVLNINSVTGGTPEYARIPLTAETDKEALEMAIQCAGRSTRESIKIMRVKNTAKLEYVYISQGYAGELEKREDLTILEDKKDMVFSPDNTFIPFNLQERI